MYVKDVTCLIVNLRFSHEVQKNYCGAIFSSTFQLIFYLILFLFWKKKLNCSLCYLHFLYAQIFLDLHASSKTFPKIIKLFGSFESMSFIL